MSDKTYNPIGCEHRKPDGLTAWNWFSAPFLHKRPLLEAKLLHILLDKFWWLSQRQRWKLAANDVVFDESELSSKENKTL